MGPAINFRHEEKGMRGEKIKYPRQEHLTQQGIKVPAIKCHHLIIASDPTLTSANVMPCHAIVCHA